MDTSKGRSNDARDALRQGAVTVLKTLRDAGFEAYWAGGCVRDLIMGGHPKDYDVATDARPEQIEALFDRTVSVGAQFGVIVVVLDVGEYEVATFRADVGYSDGRRPDHVEWADAREDVLRRDFTINGLLYDPIEEQVHDFVGGVADIERGVVRAIGDAHERFREDRLRLLRAVRFAARFGFSIEPETWQAVRAHASEIGVVSRERIHHELVRILTDGGPADGLSLLARSGMWPEVLPEIEAPDPVVERFAAARNLSAEVAWTLLMLDLRPIPEAQEALGQRLRMSVAMRKHAAHAVEIAHRLHGYRRLKLATRKRLLRRDEAVTALEAMAYAVHASQEVESAMATAREELAAWTPEELHPPRLVSGGDLKKLGLTPGPAFGDILESVETEQLEGRVTNKDEALAHATAQARRKGLLPAG